MKQWSPDPNVRGRPADYPIDVSASDIVPLMYSGVGGSTVLYAGDWPRLTPSDFRVRSLDGVADDWPLTYEELEPSLRPHRPPGRRRRASRATRPIRRAPTCPLPPLPLGARRDGRGARARPARLALVAGAERDPLDAVRRAATRAPSGARACRGARRARRRRPTSRTGRRRSRAGRACSRARERPGCCSARTGSLTGAEYVDAEGRTERAEADVVVLAANAIGSARLLLLSAGAGVPGRARQHQRPGRAAADDAPVRGRDRRVRRRRSRRGGATSARASTRCSSTRATSAAASCAARSGASRRRPAGR